MSARMINGYAALRRAEDDKCPSEEVVETNIGFLIAMRKGSDDRDGYAKAALPALISVCTRDDRNGASYPDYVARLAYEMADAMLKARAA